MRRPAIQILIIFLNIRDKSVRTFPLAFNRWLFENSHLMIWKLFLNLLWDNNF